jgi:hypothetical protein
MLRDQRIRILEGILCVSKFPLNILILWSRNITYSTYHTSEGRTSYYLVTSYGYIFLVTLQEGHNLIVFLPVDPIFVEKKMCGLFM